MSGALTVDSFAAAARAWRAALERLSLPRALDLEGRRDEASEALLNVERRLQEGPAAPVRVAVFGPTGAGKSKLFNTLLGGAVSPSSYRRPFTRSPVYSLHGRHRALAAGLRGEVRLREGQVEPDLVLIDTPDFDSVEAENRAAAERIYREADAFVVVADIHKYADASVWTYLGRILAEGKRCVFVLNKVRAVSAGGPLEDFRRRLEEASGRRGLPGPIISVADVPQPDEALLPAGEAGVLELRRAMSSLVAREEEGGGRVLLAESLRIDLRRFLSSWDALAGPAGAYRAGLARLGQELRARFERGAEELRREIGAEVDPSLKNEVYREVLRRIEKLDVLRYPRRLLSMPVEGLKRLLAKLRAFHEEPAEPGCETDPLEAANFARLEEKLLELAEETERSMTAEPACPGLLEAAGEGLRPDPLQVRARYREACAAFRSWAEGEARSAASTLAAEHKVKFVLSQVLYNAVVIGVQLKTAGALTLTEMLTDGVLSPLVAKGVGMALSSERVREFEEAARAEHARRVAAVLEEAQAGFRKTLEAQAAALQPLEEVAPQVERLRGQEERVVELFLRLA